MPFPARCRGRLCHIKPKKSRKTCAQAAAHRKEKKLDEQKINRALADATALYAQRGALPVRQKDYMSSRTVAEYIGQQHGVSLSEKIIRTKVNKEGRIGSLREKRRGGPKERVCGDEETYTAIVMAHTTNTKLVQSGRKEEVGYSKMKLNVSAASNHARSNSM